MFKLDEAVDPVEQTDTPVVEEVVVPTEETPVSEAPSEEASVPSVE